jgi:hypothetical protein
MAMAGWTGRQSSASWTLTVSISSQHPARWVAAQKEGNRNAGLFWAANRALEADRAADLSELAAAARQAGLSEPEVSRTLNSARRTGQVRSKDLDHQAEGTT